MKWDYNTYLTQPDWFLSGWRKKLLLDAQYQKEMAKKAERKH